MREIKGGVEMDLEKVQGVDFTRLEQEVMRLVRKHCVDNEELEKDMFELLKMIEEERGDSEDIKSLAFVLANKI